MSDIQTVVVIVVVVVVVVAVACSTPRADWAHTVAKAAAKSHNKYNREVRTRKGVIILHLFLRPAICFSHFSSTTSSFVHQ